MLPAIAAILGPGADALAMVKPQFELGPDRVGKGGVVRSPADRRETLLSVASGAEATGFGVLGFASSGLAGPKGNRETFVHLRRDAESIDDVDAATREVEP